MCLCVCECLELTFQNSLGSLLFNNSLDDSQDAASGLDESQDADDHSQCASETNLLENNCEIEVCVCVCVCVCVYFRMHILACGHMCNTDAQPKQAVLNRSYASDGSVRSLQSSSLSVSALCRFNET
jgi:hypothetical protein